MVVDFPDLTNSAPSTVSVSNAMLSVSSFYQSNSFNQLSLVSTVVGPLRMPSNSATYVSTFNVGGLRDDAVAAARELGYETTNYDYDIVTFTNIGFSFAGWAIIGGRGLWVQNYASTTPFDPGVTSHELGHNFGLGHPHAWVSPTVIGAGVNSGTGNVFDTMGSGPFPAAHFNSNFKCFLGWLPTHSVQTVSSNGIYRLYAMDGAGTLNVERTYSLVVPAGVTTTGAPEDYWIECRQLVMYPSLSDGIVVMWGNSLSTDDCYVLDTTPGSQAGILDASDCPVALGRSFTDPNKQITIAPIGRGGTGADTYFDVQITLNSTLVPPAITIEPTSQTALAGSNAFITVAGTSSSPIEYQWRRYGTIATGATNAVLSLTNLSAPQAGDYTVILSNSLGSVESSPATLSVAYPPPPSCYPIPTGMVAWWPGDGHPLDWIGTNHGVLQQTASYAQGKVGQAFALNGSTDFVEVPNSSLWAFGTSDFTIELWAYFSAFGGDRAFVGNDNGGGQQNKWIFWLNDSQLRFYQLTANTSADNVGTANFAPITNQWYHLAVTRVGSTFTFYINGAGVSTNSSTMSVPATTAPLTIGASEGAMFFCGLLDEIRIYKRGLSASEVLGIYTSGSTGVCWPPNPPAYVEFSKPAVTVEEGTENANLCIRRSGNTASSVSVTCISSNGTAVAGVNYISVSNAILFNASESSRTVSIGILNDGLMDGTKQFALQLCGASSNAVIGTKSTGAINIVDSSCLPPPTGMVAWWPAEGNAYDLGSTNNGTLENGATFAPGEAGYAFSLNGVDQFVSLPDNSAWGFGTNAFSIDLWANYSAIDGSPAFLANDQGGGATHKWIFWLNGGTLQFHVNMPTGATYIGSAAFSPALGQWYHIAITRSGSTFLFYINGSLVSSNTSTVVIPTANAPLTIGQAEGSFNFNGMLDEIHIYNRALSSSEIEGIYNAGSDGLCPPAPPMFTTQPQSQTVEVGVNVTFTASASGFSPLNYQWQLNGSNIVGATGASLSLTNVQSLASGDYSVVVTNIAGSITSTNALLTVNSPVPTTFQSITRLLDGSIELVISGEPGSINTLEFSTNLVNWQMLSNIIVLDVPLVLSNNPQVNGTKGFYRTYSTGGTP